MVSDIEVLRDAVQAFCAQDDLRVLVVTCSDDDAVAVLAALGSSPEQPRGLLVTLPDPWNDESRGSLFDVHPPDGVVAVLLCATSRDELQAHAARVLALVSEIAPWQPRVRWIVRDTDAPPLLRDALLREGAPPCGWLDFAQDRRDAEARLLDDAADPARSPTERLTALTQRAWLDVSRGRHTEALDRFGVLHEAWADRGDASMQSLCLQGVASVYRFRQAPASARTWFQRAAAAALPAGVSTALLGALAGAAETSYEVGALDDAEQYFSDAARVAASLRAWVPLCDALLKAGIVAVARNDASRAVWHWEQCRRVSAKMDVVSARVDVLARLEALYEHAGLRDHAAHARAERVELAGGASVRGAS